MRSLCFSSSWIYHIERAGHFLINELGLELITSPASRDYTYEPPNTTLINILNIKQGWESVPILFKMLKIKK